jgi:hypothetical protein
MKNGTNNEVSSFREFSGQGTENITASDQKLPILKILHASSPVLDESEARFNEKARQGDIYNEITGSLYKSKNGVLVVPCGYVNTFNEWADRGDSPGRPIAVHTDRSILDKCTRDPQKKDRLDNGHYVEDTGNHFVYILNEKYEPIETALITMKSTQRKKSKLWNSMMMSKRMQDKQGFYRPASWMTVYKLNTTKESNGENSWWGWNIEFVRFLDRQGDALTRETTEDFHKITKTSNIFGKIEYADEETKVAQIPNQSAKDDINQFKE